MAFVINWEWTPGAKCYIFNPRSNSRPYTQLRLEAKTWKTRETAQRYLDRRDPTWASQCKIEEIS